MIRTIPATGAATDLPSGVGSSVPAEGTSAAVVAVVLSVAEDVGAADSVVGGSADVVVTDTVV